MTIATRARRHSLLTAGTLTLCLGLTTAWALLVGPRSSVKAKPMPAPRVELSAEDEAPANTITDANRGRSMKEVGVGDWHKAGHLGRGVKVAILDSGFRGYRDALGDALPTLVNAKSFRKDGKLEARDSQHGILCGEVIHSLAPESEILFANWEPNHPESFLDAVRWAKAQGAKVISCSMIAPSWSDGEGGGPIHRELSKILGTSDDAMLLFASAGNTAKRHWGGRFSPSTSGLHQWEEGRVDNGLSPYTTTDPVTVELSAPAGSVYEVTIYNGDAKAVVGATEPGLCPGSVVARFDPKADAAYRVQVRHLSGPVGNFHLVALGATLDVAASRSSIPFPADGAEVVAVGAVDGNGKRASYSSCGPTASCPKPDLMAAVPWASRLRGGKTFAGTSAAAPQAAGLAAVLWGANPKWSAARVRETLATTASDLGPTGHDCETGFGLVRLPALPEVNE